MRVLVTWDSKRGGTEDIGRTIGQTLTAGFPASAMARTRSGDWRDFERVRAWAARLATELPQARPASPAATAEPAARMAPATRAVGLWSAVLATVFSIAYDLGQIAEWLGWLGSNRGPESASTPLGIAVLLTPSILLASAFLLLIVSVHQVASSDRKVWSHAAVAFATLYAVLVSATYFVQLTLVGPRLARGDVRGIEPFLFIPFDSFLYAVDILGYSFMSVATLLASRVFSGYGVRRAARFFLTANGLLVPFIALQMFWHPLIWGATLWAVTFPASTWALALFFARAERRGDGAGHGGRGCAPRLARAPAGPAAVDDRGPIDRDREPGSLG
jgi:hypothetical protein